MDPGFSDGEPSPRNGWRFFQAAVIFAIVFGGAMAVTELVSYALPRVFYSRAIVEVRPKSTSRNVYDPNVAPPPDPDRPSAQFQKIQSDSHLYVVIDHLKLIETWSAREGRALSKEEVCARLRFRLKLGLIPKTDLIEIGVYSPDRQEAADIANTVAIVFLKVWRDEKYKVRDAALGQLRDEVLAERKKVDAMQMEMQKIRDRDHIADPNTEAFDNSEANNLPNSQSQDYLKIKGDYLKARRVLEEAERRLAAHTVELKMNLVPLKIWEKAEPATQPSRLYEGRILALGACVGVVLGALAAGLFLRFGARR